MELEWLEEERKNRSLRREYSFARDLLSLPSTVRGRVVRVEWVLVNVTACLKEDVDLERRKNLILPSKMCA